MKSEKSHFGRPVEGHEVRQSNEKHVQNNIEENARLVVFVVPKGLLVDRLCVRDGNIGAESITDR